VIVSQQRLYPLSYALTLRIMLVTVRRKIGMMGNSMPNPVPEVMPPAFADAGGVPQPMPFTMEELGLVWPSDRGIFSPSAIPPWLQEQVRATPIECCFLIPTPLAELGGPWISSQRYGWHILADHWCQWLDGGLRADPRSVVMSAGFLIVCLFSMSLGLFVEAG
jgi:hypothetical protein